jgi:uncharacterized protein YcfJ
MTIKQSLSMTSGLAMLLASTCAFAAGGYGQRGGEFDYATVLDVQPMTRVVQVPADREECWEEPVRHYNPGYHARPYSYTPPIAGGIIGAVIGNQFGSGSGKDWATVAGTALGASVGRDYGMRRAYEGAYSYTSTQQRCRTVRDFREQEEADGYRVTYSYNGREYVTQTRNHPGEQLRVRVNVVPAEY